MSLPTNSELPDLIRRVQQRDEAAARQLVEALGPLVARIINAYPSLRDEQDDIMQDIFFKLFRKLPSYRFEAPLEHWVARVARTTCIDHLRHQQARPLISTTDLDKVEIATEGDPTTSIDAASGLLERLFATLRPLDAWLLREVELKERPIADVAEEAGWNGAMAKVRLFRARHRLKQAYLQLESSSAS